MNTVSAAVALTLASVAAAGPVIGVLPASRQGIANLVDNTGATQLRQAIIEAWPSVQFVPLPVVSTENLASCDAVVLGSGAAGQNAITPLTAAEQQALRAFVNGGGGAVIFSDNDTFAGDADAANASVVGPFGVTADGTGLPWQQTVVPSGPPAPPAPPIMSGPFGTVASFSVGWSGWYPNAATVPGATVRGQLAQNAQPALLEFAPGALAAGSGRAVLFADTTMMGNGYFPASNRTVVLNALDAVLRRCGPADVGSQGGVPGPDTALDNNDFIVFIDLFFAHSPLADRGITGGIPGHDSAWDNNDFIVFIDQFFDGC